MGRSEILKQRQASLREDITSLLDSFLIGTVAKSPSMSGYILTTKKEGKKVTFFVRKDFVPMALEKSRRIIEAFDPALKARDDRVRVLECLFHAIRPPIPRASGHLIHDYPAGQSTVIRPTAGAKRRG